MVVFISKNLLALIDHKLVVVACFNTLSFQSFLRQSFSICNFLLLELFNWALRCPNDFNRLFFSLQRVSAKEISGMVHSRYIIHSVTCIITHAQLRSHFDC